MKKLVLLTTIAMGLLATRAQAAFDLGLRVGYAATSGDAVSDNPMKESIKSQVPVQLDVGYHLHSQLSLGGFVALGLAQVGAGCSEASCLGHVLRFGVQGTWHFWQRGVVLPWFGAGLGYEWSRYTLERSGSRLEVNMRGVEFFNAQGGFGYVVSDKLSVGPFAQVSLGHYNALSVASPLGDSFGTPPSGSVHAFFTCGLRVSML